VTFTVLQTKERKYKRNEFTQAQFTTTQVKQKNFLNGTAKIYEYDLYTEEERATDDLTPLDDHQLIKSKRLSDRSLQESARPNRLIC
jgi:hypothetical protein